MSRIEHLDSSKYHGQSNEGVFTVGNSASFTGITGTLLARSASKLVKELLALRGLSGEDSWMLPEGERSRDCIDREGDKEPLVLGTGIDSRRARVDCFGVLR